MRNNKEIKLHSIPIRIILPSLISIILFIFTIFYIALPAYHHAMLEDKKEMIRELARTIYSNLTQYELNVQFGKISRIDAQKEAIYQIRNLRYGKELKDYFWINDMTPRMVMHPYRSELDGLDVSNFADQEGRRIFTEAVEIAKQSGEGYLEYKWQWKDEPTRIGSKLSYVIFFEPWGWVIGTGIYLDDVEVEFAAVSRKLLYISSLILACITLLLLMILRQTMKSENKRRLSEKFLLESEEKYRALTENSSDVIMRFDSRHRHLFVNKIVKQQTGIPADQYIGKTHTELGFPPDLAIMWDQALNEVFQRKQTAHREFQLPTGVWIDWLLIPEFSPDGEVKTVITSARDITQRKKMEEQLRTGRERYMALYNNAHVGLFHSNWSNGVILEANERIAEIFGFSTRNQFIAEFRFQNHYLDFDVHQIIEKELHEKGELQKFNAKCRRLDGTEIWINISIKLIAEKGHLEGVVVDITDELEATGALRESEKKFRTLAETTNACIFMIQGSKFTYVSPTAEKISGYKEKEVYRFNNYLEVIHPDHHAYINNFQIQKPENDLHAAHREIKIIHKTGEVRWINFDLNQIVYQGVPTIIGTCMDITERKETEKQIFQTEKMAALGQIVAGVAHEINNPNNFIALNIPVLHEYWKAIWPVLDNHAAKHFEYQILGMPYQMFREDVSELLTNIEHGSKRIDGIVKELRQYMNSQNDSEMEVDTLSNVINNALNLVGKQISKSINQIDIEIDNELPPMLMNSRCIEQVMINLLVNAAHAANKPNSQLMIQARRCPNALQCAEIIVSDNGCGIPEHIQHRIFDPFFTTKDAINGTGLGLAITKSILEKHNGTIRVNSKVNEGSSFSVQLPIKEARVA